ncbi:DEKNAAC104303 [Brettanomyces naardenensis]|uniref:DEKNAAC104303 n=1 Tax=Brettanomyces naardenensis TaxID=13370 RepID=A0A448YQJ6_BRENA|nr:DEKNAAC104303 [Brettanomyces naardenensis]
MLSRRFFSTTASKLARAEVTKLSNGLTVISKPGNSSLSSIGLYLNSGSRSENAYNSGVSTLTGDILKNSTLSRKAFESAGVKVTSTNGKEYSGLAVTSFAPGNSSAAVAAIDSLVKETPKLIADELTVKENVARAVAFADKFEETPKKMVLEHLTATAFQGTSLALPSYGKAETLETLQTIDLQDFLSKNLVSSNATLISYGSDVNHDELVKAAAKLAIPTGAKIPFEAASFLGSDVRLRDDTMPDAHVAIAVKTPGAKSEHDFLTGLVAAHINGEYLGRDSLYTPFEGPKFSQLVASHGWSNYYNHFQIGYSDIGLWGAYFNTEAIEYVDEFTHFLLKSWNRFSTGTISSAELEKAKQELKVVLASAKADQVEELDSIAASYLARGILSSDEELIHSIDAISHKDLVKWAQNYLYDQDIAIAGNGQIEDLFDYNRIRNDMSMMRW